MFELNDLHACSAAELAASMQVESALETVSRTDDPSANPGVIDVL